MKVTFVNHASVMIESAGICLLTDPWLEGPVFNNGWDLLIPTPFDRAALFEKITHVWLSHEHPDHFSPKFFVELAKARGDAVPVYFQATRDGRVREFCRSRGLRVVELPHGDETQLAPDFSVTCVPHEFYDSWLLVKSAGQTLLNLNDCVFADEPRLQKLRRRTGAIDVLLTQYSYAAWKGGRAHEGYRAQAASRKLESITKQISVLEPRYVIPFASMAYFSNVENAYMNDRVNDVAAATRTIAAASAEPVALFPGDAWEVGTQHDNADPLRRYAEVYDKREALPLREPGPSVDVAQLRSQFEAYRKRVFEHNSAFVIRLLRQLPAVEAFHPLRVLLTDLDALVSVSVVDGFRVLQSGRADVSMHSNSLSFVFTSDFGCDTLTVNGRFEATPEGFARLTNSRANGSLNALGLTLSLDLLKNLDVVFILLRKLVDVTARLRAQPSAVEPHAVSASSL